jgi:cell division transport system ATP-binding protein
MHLRGLRKGRISAGARAVAGLRSRGIETARRLGQKAAGIGGRAVIELEQVGYSYGGGALLSDVSLSLPAGSFHFLTGPSGSGKTTLLKLCYGALRPTSGRVSALGADIAGLSRDEMAELRRRIGVVHQDCWFLDHLPVADNIALPLIVSGRVLAQEQENLSELIGWVGLSDRADAFPPELSGGERQRAALARAVILSPDTILADEPTGNIDWEMSQRLLKLLIDLNRMGKTVVIASHDLSLIRAAKSQVQARVLRISDRQVQLAGADL